MPPASGFVAKLETVYQKVGDLALGKADVVLQYFSTERRLFSCLCG